MNNSTVKKLCMDLMYADTEERVVEILKKANLWNCPKAWRYYGDREMNWSSAGNQSSEAEFALVEKLINAIDAKLMNKCFIRGIEPESKEAPQSITEAVAMFFDDNSNGRTAGLVREWSDAKRREVARGITLTCTGNKPEKGYPCLTIADNGEGQTPGRFPKTLLSLEESIKNKIPFVHGRFDMGGTGAFRFCGNKNLQLVISKRNPVLVEDSNDKKDIMWGFSIVRRNFPNEERPNSIYEYLAPEGCENNPSKGEVLGFESERLPIFPEGQKPYSRNSSWGTLIKLYEYKTNNRTHMFMRDGLQYRLDVLLPRPALPIRLHECRKYSGKKGSFETTLSGIYVRLEDDKAKNVEQGFPYTGNLNVLGEKLKFRIYAIKQGAWQTYRKADEGIIFFYRSQTQGKISHDFFRRTQVALSPIRHSIFMMINCSNLSNLGFEEFFMNSRDRINKGSDLYKEIEKELEALLKTHRGLRDLKGKRLREEKERKLKDDKPLEKILDPILKKSPVLNKLFLEGERLSNPFKMKDVSEKDEEFKGERYPTYFKFKDLDYGKTLDREFHINRSMRCRITFETDAANDYFDRDIDSGEFHLYVINENGEKKEYQGSYTPNLANGICTLNITLPDTVQKGDEINFISRVFDPTRLNSDEFINQFKLAVKTSLKPSEYKGKRRKPKSNDNGNKRETPSGIQLPEVRRIYEAGWNAKEPPFNQYTALRAELIDTSEHKGKTIYEYVFYINMDNRYLLSEIKGSSGDSDIIKERFRTGMVLLGMGLIRQSIEDNKQAEIEDKIEEFTTATAPILIPMIDGLGSGLEIEKD